MPTTTVFQMVSDSLGLVQEAPVVPDALQDAALAPPPAADVLALGSLWDLAGRAGGFQWPIFAVLVAGLLLLALAFTRLVSDRHAARALRSLALDQVHVGDVRSVPARAARSLYGRLATSMVDLWAAGADLTALAREAVHLTEAARAPYRRTERLITFLSGTAGGLGLLGTLVGIYALFSGGTRDAQTIFAGIGVAVISTLLGIVVTIVLELLEVITSGWASRYHDGAEAWAARLRYRLTELGPTTEAWSARARRGGVVEASVPDGLRVEKVGAVPAFVRPGQAVGPLGVRARVGARAAVGVPVVLRIAEGGGCFDAGARRLETTTTGNGMAAFMLTTGSREGRNVVVADVDGTAVRFCVTTRATDRTDERP